ncbi:hypothetical protein EJ08DRAFT_487776 [Tothia fuscella]|uniref:Uncharacterized protein n=1 Tax=Tothia fuscella TaxID=1048955 RepID=A0A9P4TUH7_9PEZI|nr:hypothetical protein EJ08DRAFT_487776 [Tothia fuscella]
MATPLLFRSFGFLKQRINFTRLPNTLRMHTTSVIFNTIFSGLVPGMVIVYNNTKISAELGEIKSMLESVKADFAHIERSMEKLENDVKDLNACLIQCSHIR